MILNNKMISNTKTKEETRRTIRTERHDGKLLADDGKDV